MVWPRNRLTRLRKCRETQGPDSKLVLWARLGSLILKAKLLLQDKGLKADSLLMSCLPRRKIAFPANVCFERNAPLEGACLEVVIHSPFPSSLCQ